MTLESFKNFLIKQIKEAKTHSEIPSLIRRSERSIYESGITEIEYRWIFWNNVYKEISKSLDQNATGSEENRLLMTAMHEVESLLHLMNKVYKQTMQKNKEMAK